MSVVIEVSQRELFRKLYPGKTKADTHRIVCPYRVCPLGAHVDHQHGLISGFALDKGIELVYAATEDGTVDLASMNFEGLTQFNIHQIPSKLGNWGDYIRGACYSLIQKYRLRRGICGVMKGTLPIGGLSSSASVILATLMALCRVNELAPTKQELIDIALYAENVYVGLSVGKLDQSCEVLSRKDHLLYLDTKTEQYELISKNPNIAPFEIAIFFSGIQRALVGSAFNMRVDECKAAAYALKAFTGIEYGKFNDTRLRDVPEEIYINNRERLPLQWAKRAAHFFGEFHRVQQGAEAWRSGDIKRFGELIFESGHSSINNFETGSPELIALYDIMLDTPGVYGGRFSGAGFKGCCMAIVDPNLKETILETVTRRYINKFPHLRDAFSIHFCNTADGARLQ